MPTVTPTVRIALPIAADAAPPAEELHLRALEPQDIATLSQRFAAIEPWTLYPFSAAAFETFFTQHDPGAERFAFVSDDCLAGAAVIRPNWLRGPYLQFLTVFPEFHGKGFAPAFLKWFESEAKKGQHKNLWVATSDFNTKARRIYAKFGFEPAANIDDLVKNGVNEILMRKKLSDTNS